MMPGKKLFFFFHNLFLKEPAVSYVQETETCVQKIITFFGQIQRHRLLLIVPSPVAHNSFFLQLKEKAIRANLHITVYEATSNGPSISSVEQCLHKYYSSQSEAILVLGADSLIDLGKAVKARVLNPNKSIYQLKGFGKVRNRHKEPPLVLVPSDLSGQEVNYSCFVIDHTNQVNFPLYDLAILPDFVIYCAELILDLNKQAFWGNLTYGLGLLTDQLLLCASDSERQKNIQETLQLALKSLREFETLDLENRENMEQAYSLTVNLQKASLQSGRLLRKSLPGPFQLLYHALQITLDLGRETISPPLLYATLQTFCDLIEKEPRTEQLEQILAPYQEILQEILHVVRDYQKNWNLERKLDGVKPNNLQSISEYFDLSYQNYGVLPCSQKDFRPAEQRIVEKLI